MNAALGRLCYFIERNLKKCDAGLKSLLNQTVKVAENFFRLFDYLE